MSLDDIVAQKKIAGLEEEIGRLNDFVDRWETWANAYPTDIFTPFTPEELKKHSILITRASAAMGRHILDTMKKDIEELRKGER